VNDTGFVSKDAARMALRRLKLRAGLRDVQSLTAALLDRLDHAGDPCGDAVSASPEGTGLLGHGDLERGFGDHAVSRIEGQDVRENELLQGVDLVVQFLNSLLDDVGHGRFSNCFNNLDATPASPVAHRLSEETSHT
jgi:hypothetical protein